MPKQVTHKDWGSWWDGLRSKSMRAGAESLATNFTALLGTNGVAAMGIPGLADIGMNWKTAILTCVIQFVLRVGLSAALYVQNKPDPDVIVETIDTTHVTKDAMGKVIEQGSSTTVTETVIKKPEEPKV